MYLSRVWGEHSRQGSAGAKAERRVHRVERSKKAKGRSEGRG